MASDRLPDTGLNKKILNNDELHKEATELEEEIHALKVAYDQYFLGLEKHLPSKEHAELKRRVMKLKGAFVRTTAVKFRINAVQQKFITYERLWARTMQEIENGTYVRDLKRLQRKAATATKPAEKKPEPAQAQPSAPLPPGMPPPPPAAAMARPAGAPPPPPAAARAAGNGLSDAKVKAIFDAYVQAKRSCKEDTSKLSIDTMAATLRKQVPDLLKKHNAKDVDFKVVIKDGKAILRAVPK